MLTTDAHLYLGLTSSWPSGQLSLVNIKHHVPSPVSSFFFAFRTGSSLCYLLLHAPNGFFLLLSSSSHPEQGLKKIEGSRHRFEFGHKKYFVRGRHDLLLKMQLSTLYERARKFKADKLADDLNKLR
ncbi:unnamed protein product, partial [Thlaspi arvense]